MSTFGITLTTSQAAAIGNLVDKDDGASSIVYITLAGAQSINVALNDDLGTSVETFLITENGEVTES